MGLLEQTSGLAVSARALRKIYGEGEARTEALKGLDLSVPEGQFLCIMGPSGSGKSTLLHLLAGLETPTSGSVVVGGQRIDQLSEDEAARFRRRNIGVIFQFFNLIPTLTVDENIALPRLLEGERMSALDAGVQDVLRLLGLEGLRGRSPANLSGGEMQRVALARALFAEPKLILADEPTGNLDSKAGEEVLALLRRAPDELGVTLILVTHDLRAASYADRMLVMHDGAIEDDVPSYPVGSLLP